MRLLRKRRFNADVARSVAYIADINPDAAGRFLQAIENECKFIALNPGIGSKEAFPRLVGIRSWRVAGFENYLIFYRADSNELTLLRLLHGARDLPRLLGS
jgi:toxin ParE1/3/4